MIWLCAALALTVLILSFKLVTIRRSARELRAGLAEKLAVDTNTLLSVSTRDPELRALAADLNAQLRILRSQRQNYQQGDRELKEAVTGISHDLRTPLTAICGYLELLKREDLGENAARYLGFIENRTEAMKALTEELLRYSVILSGDTPVLEEVNLSAALEESLGSFYAALTQRGIAPAVTMPDQAVTVLGSREALARILSNILSNALKYSDGDLDVVLTPDGSVCFTNTASRLDPVQVGRLFDRFFSVESGQSSAGLGLSIAKQLTEQMSGQIQAGYENGRFWIRVQFSQKECLHSDAL